MNWKIRLERHGKMGENIDAYVGNVSNENKKVQELVLSEPGIYLALNQKINQAILHNQDKIIEITVKTSKV